MSTRFPFCLLHAGTLSAHNTIVFAFNSIQSFIHLPFKKFAPNFRIFSTQYYYILLAKQLAYSATATQAFQQNVLFSTTAKSSIAGQLTTSFSASARISSTFIYNKTQHTYSHHGCL
jgi:hypothetical protein